jgi:hypothetical protein
VIGGAGGPLDEATREQLRRMQEFLVRLYFSDELQLRCLENPVELRLDLGIEPRFWSVVPELTRDGFRAECRGRRLLVARDIAGAYPHTIECLVPALAGGEGERVAALERSDAFTAFLDSEYFWSSRWSLPHPAGLGRGYEVIGKFFNWTLSTFGLREATAPRALRERAYVEFAGHLVALAAYDAHHCLGPARAGVRFCSSHAGRAGDIVVDPALDVRHYESLPESLRALPKLEHLLDELFADARGVAA